MHRILMLFTISSDISVEGGRERRELRYAFGFPQDEGERKRLGFAREEGIKGFHKLKIFFFRVCLYIYLFIENISPWTPS